MVATELRVTPGTVRQWRRRWREGGAKQGPGVCPAHPILSRLVLVAFPGSRRTRSL
ncbi:helix-turn-helix domain-containing protein [Streptomyces sp. NPDC050625]|uniref:helix-turn-helix domain-containing protein n=1 Tax=Streptomyces sp. NPDC050625 TaxID=3154629 RepID=UPI00342E8C58